MHLWFYSR